VNGYRASRIHEFISEQISQKIPFSIKNFQKLQVDTKSLGTIDFLKSIRPFSSQVASQLSGISAEAWTKLLEFDGIMSVDSPGASIVSVMRFFLLRNIVEPVLGENLTHIFLGMGPEAILLDVNEFLPYSIVTLIRFMENRLSWWISKAGGHEVILSKSIMDSTRWLQRELGNDISQWHYGKIHKVVFHHAFSVIPILGNIFDVGPYPLGGNDETVMLAGIHPVKPYDIGGWATHWRFCVDMGNLEAGGSMNAPGQSGNLWDYHYDDLMDMWLRGEFKPKYWRKEHLMENLESKFVLKSQ